MPKSPRLPIKFLILFLTHELQEYFGVGIIYLEHDVYLEVLNSIHYTISPWGFKGVLWAKNEIIWPKIRTSLSYK